MRLASFVLALALLGGCDSSNCVEVFATYEDSPVLEHTHIDTASELLGVDIQLVSKPRRGVIELKLSEIDPDREGTAGHTESKERCAKSARAELEPEVIAHELGHLLGLDHQPYPNLMSATVGIANGQWFDPDDLPEPDQYLEGWQEDIVLEGAQALSRCRSL